MITLTMAQATVSELSTSERWYRQVFGAPPDARPMDGLLEWHFGARHGVQVHRDPSRAGGCTVVVGESDIDAALARLDAAGIDHPAPSPGGGGLLVTLTDPDGNRLVMVGSAADAGLDSAAGGVHRASFRFERRLDVPAERVWEAYADVDQRRQWAVPEGEAVAYVASDFAPGGADEYRCGPPGALSTRIAARYLRVDPPRSFVVVSQLYDDRGGGSALAVDVSHWHVRPDGDGAVLVVEVDVTSLVGDGMLDGYRNGHERTLDHLERFLAGQAGLTR